MTTAHSLVTPESIGNIAGFLLFLGGFLILLGINKRLKTGSWLPPKRDPNAVTIVVRRRRHR